MGSAGTDNFCLRWNDFAENVSGAFRDLRDENDLFDVTLACSDAGTRTLQAHKVILSACSNFFKGMFRQQMHSQRHPNPYIYLRGVSFTDLASILDFIYNGEVNVAQEDLNSFLAVAEELQIKGLTNRDGSSGDGSSAPTKRPVGRPRLDAGPPVKKSKRSSPAPPPPAKVDNEDMKEMVNIKDDPEAMASTSAVPGGGGGGGGGDEGGDYGGDEFDESYDGFYEDDGAGDLDGADEGGDGKGRHDIIF